MHVLHHSDGGQPHDVVGEVVDKTAEGRQRLQDLEPSCQFGGDNDIMYFLNFIQPEQQAENLPPVRDLGLEFLGLIERRNLLVQDLLSQGHI